MDAEGERFSTTSYEWLTRNYPTLWWHQDGTFGDVPPRICMLGATKLPRSGGGTGFADLAAAYDALDETRERIAHLNAFHSNLIGTTRVLPREHQQTVTDMVGDALDYSGKTKHVAPLRPLVKVHPVTGRKMLMVGRHNFCVTGMLAEESERFLAALEEAACQPPRVYEHSWEVGELIVWDNFVRSQRGASADFLSLSLTEQVVAGQRFLHRVRPYDEGAEERELLNCRILGDPKTDAGLRTAEAAPERSIRMQRAELERLRSRWDSPRL